MLAVIGSVTATPAVPSVALIIDEIVVPFTPVTATGGTGALVYGGSPALSEVLVSNATTGTITGIPAAVLAATTFIVTVTNTNGATATANFSLSVETLSLRLAPSKDPKVIGIVNAQTDAAKRFAASQVSNFSDHLSQLHGNGCLRDSWGIGLNAGSNAMRHPRTCSRPIRRMMICQKQIRRR